MLIMLVVVVRNVTSAITDRGTLELQKLGIGNAKIRLLENLVVIKRF